MNTGRKDDGGKLRWDLMQWGPLEEIAKVLTFGAKKYGDDNWKIVLQAEGGRGRYFAAMVRHISADWLGEKTDPESGLAHLAHAGCCLLFLLWQVQGTKADA